ncbi:unnamed protein product [Urochloa humidicola]
MYFHALRAASSSSRGGARLAGLALGRRAGGAAGVAARGRSVSATSAANAPVPGDQGVAMDQPKQQQQQPQVPLQQDAGAKNKRDDAHKTIGDVMSDSFGEGYSTRCEEEGFGVVYGRHDPDEEDSGAEIHPGHPEYDALQGSEVKEKEKARHHKDDKHAT